MAQSFDLRLLPIIESVLATASVTKTARELGVEPSSVSRALTKAREHFGDALLVRAGKRLQPTPKGSALALELHDVSARLDRILRADSENEISRTTRRVSLRCDDIFAGVLGSRLLKVLDKDAPGLRLRIVPEQPHDESGLRDGRFDLVLGAGLTLPIEAIVRTIGEERLVGVCRKNHPALKFNTRSIGPKKGADLMACGRVIAEIQEQHERAINLALPADERAAPALLVVPTLFAVATTIARCDRFGILARQLAGALGLQIFEMPGAIAPLPVRMAWHPRDHSEPVHIWFRELVGRIALQELRHGR